jgi:tetratricopeptide (TPR) repeat protein
MDGIRAGGSGVLGSGIRESVVERFTVRRSRRNIGTALGERSPVRRPALLPVLAFAILGTLSVSSPISAQDSSEDDVPEKESLRSKSEIDTTDPDEIRKMVERGDFEEALEAVRRRIASYPDLSDVARTRLLEARILARLGEVQDAGRAYRRLFEDPDVGGLARTEAHDLLVRTGQFESADRMTAAAVQDSGMTAAAVPDSGMTAAAVPDSGVTADGGPDSSGTSVADPDELLRRSYSWSTQGHYRDVAAWLLEPAAAGNGRAGVLRANALLALGERAEAESLYLSVLSNEQDASVRQVAHFGLGQVARLRGARAVRAIQDEKAVTLGPAPWAELDWGQALRALGRRDDARRRLTSASQADPALSVAARLALARLDEEEGLADAAIEELVGALEGRFADFLVWTRLGDLLLQEGQDEAGLGAYRRALAIFPSFPPARDRLTRALAARGRWEEAPEPGAEAWDLPGWTWDRLLDGDLPFYDTVADITEVPPTDPRRLVIALVQLQAGFPAGAIAWTSDAGGDPRLEAIRAEALERVGREEEAVTVWESVLDHGASTALPLENLAHLLEDSDSTRADGYRQELRSRLPDSIRARLRFARRLEEREDWAPALLEYEAADAYEGWLSPDERRRIRVALEDVRDQIENEDEDEDEAAEGSATP